MDKRSNDGRNQRIRGKSYVHTVHVHNKSMA